MYLLHVSFTVCLCARGCQSVLGSRTLCILWLPTTGMHLGLALGAACRLNEACVLVALGCSRSAPSSVLTSHPPALYSPSALGIAARGETDHQAAVQACRGRAWVP